MPSDPPTEKSTDTAVGPIGAPGIEQLPRHQQMFMAAGAERRRRARPMSPDDRRNAIIEATLPLLRKQGFDITTKQIAAAAGVAEGTIFRVFSDKDELLRQVLEAALDPTDTEERLLAIDRSEPLEERVRAAAEIMNERLRSVIDLMVVIQKAQPPEPPKRPDARHAGTLAALKMVFEPDRENLRVDPAEAARLLRVMCFAGFHPFITDHNPLTSQQVVDVLLNGIRST